jgi:type IV pilus biogenesis protein CpaD/CtpE
MVEEITDMKKTILTICILALSTCALSAQAPAPPANPLSSEIKQAYDRVANNLLAMAVKMPEENYAFKPVPEIRSFAGTLGHTIDYQMRICAMANGGTAQATAANMTAKAELVAAMKASMAECDKAFGSLTDAAAVQLSSSGRGGQRSKLGTLYGLVTHDNEEYGYLAVHLRLKGIVPPSSEGGGMGGMRGAPAPGR